MKIRITLIASDILKDQFMHAADVFEPFKVLIESPTHIDGELQAGATIASVIEKTRKVIDEQGKYRIIAAFHPYIEEGAWCDRSIIMVSTGHKFGKFADLLESLRYAGPPPARYIEERNAILNPTS